MRTAICHMGRLKDCPPLNCNRNSIAIAFKKTLYIDKLLTNWQKWRARARVFFQDAQFCRGVINGTIFFTQVDEFSN